MISESKLLAIGADQLKSCKQLSDIFIKTPERVSIAGQKAEDGMYIVSVFYVPAAPTNEELKMLSSTGGEELQRIAFCKVNQENGSVLEPEIINIPGDLLVQ